MSPDSVETRLRDLDRGLIRMETQIQGFTTALKELEDDLQQFTRQFGPMLVEDATARQRLDYFREKIDAIEGSCKSIREESEARDRALNDRLDRERSERISEAAKERAEREEGQRRRQEREEADRKWRIVTAVGLLTASI